MWTAGRLPRRPAMRGGGNDDGDGGAGAPICPLGSVMPEGYASTLSSAGTYPTTIDGPGVVGVVGM